MDRDTFEAIVTEVLMELPAEFRLKLDNVEFIVELWPTQKDLRSVFAHPGVTLFGLYNGIPRTKRGSNYSGVLPDKITIFAGPILHYAQSSEQIKTQIRKTVLHEIGHYFGMSEEAIQQAEQV